jgi:hypothetical protein
MRTSILALGLGLAAVGALGGAARADDKAPPAAPAPAPKPDASVRTKFYNFDDLLIDGELRRPTALLVTEREPAKLERILRMRRSFLRDLSATEKLPELVTPRK